MKAKLIAIAIGASALLGGLVVVEATSLAPGDIAAHETTTQDYKLIIDADNPLEFATQTTQTAVGEKPADGKLYITAPVTDEEDTGGSGTTLTESVITTATATTQLGSEIEFGTTNAAAADGYALNFTSYAQYWSYVGEIHNTSPINGIKSIKVTFETGNENRPFYVNLAYGYQVCSYTSTFMELMDSETIEYEQNGFSSLTDGVVEYDFQDDIAPCYFSLEVDRGNGSSTGSDQKVKSIEITYGCEPVSEEVAEVTVTNKLQLNQASLYYRTIGKSLGGTIKLGADVNLTRDLRFRHDTSAYEVTLDLNGHALTAIQGERFYKSGMTWEQGLIAVSGYAHLTITGKGSLNAGEIDTNLVTMASGRSTQNSLINIEGGAYNAKANRSAVYMQASSAYPNAGTLKVSGGTFKNADGSANTRLIGVASNQNATITVSGGTFVGFDPTGYVETTFFDVASSATETEGVTQYVVSPKSGEITLSTDVTLSSPLNPGEALTINGNSHTITLGALFSGTAIHAENALTIKDVTFKFDNAVGVGHGIFAEGEATLENVIINGFDANTERLYPIALYGGGNATLTNVQVNGQNYDPDDYSAGDVWVGDHRQATIDGGSIGSVFVNASEGAGILSAGHVNFTNAPTIGTLTLEWEKNAKYQYGTSAINTVYMRATFSGDSTKVSKIVTNPQSIDLSGLTDVTGVDANHWIVVSNAAEFNRAATNLSSTGGVISINQNFSLTERLVIPEESKGITVMGNGHTINCTGLSDHAIYVQNHAVADIRDLTLEGFSTTDNAKYPIVFYGGYTGGLHNVTVNGKNNISDGSAADPAWADVWVGDHRSIVIDGGNIGSVFVNASEGANVLSAGSVVLKNTPAIANLNLAWAKNETYAYGAHEAGTVYMKATHSGTFTGTLNDNAGSLETAGLSEVASDYAV